MSLLLLPSGVFAQTVCAETPYISTIDLPEASGAALVFLDIGQFVAVTSDSGGSGEAGLLSL
ncbi:MAG: hypothetical protein KC561_02560, partial [Myxococcales bacterium]|nr:hypothetical protein [Myxococcales bacterium]